MCTVLFEIAVSSLTFVVTKVIKVIFSARMGGGAKPEMSRLELLQLPPENVLLKENPQRQAGENKWIRLRDRWPKTTGQNIVNVTQSRF